MDINNITITSGFGGEIKIKALSSSGKVYVIEKDHIIKYLKDMIDAKGFTTSLSPRQQYERLIINY